MEALTLSGLFALFSSCSLTASLYLRFCIKCTNGLSKEEFKVLYYPENMKKAKSGDDCFFTVD
jgi:hypothetical protein